MSITLLDIQMRNGTRLFVAFPLSMDWETLEQHLTQMPCTCTKRITPSGITWLDFEFGGHSFSISDQYQDYSAFGPHECDEQTLYFVAEYMGQLLGPSKRECPRCNGQGDIKKAIIVSTGTTIYICDECDAVWFSMEDIGRVAWIDFATYMKAIGGQGLWSELTLIPPT